MARTKPKSATDPIAEKMGKLVDRAAEHMSDSQFKEAEKKSAAITSRVRAHALRRDKVSITEDFIDRATGCLAGGPSLLEALLRDRREEEKHALEKEHRLLRGWAKSPRDS